jgi:phosphate:Na+ symporter
VISTGVAALASASPDTGDPEVFPLLMGLFGGLALFLFGMEEMAGALKQVAGERIRTTLRKLTRNRFTGVLTGAFVTAVVQSSSVTTVLMVGFITAGLMSMTQSIGVIMGANIGSTITAQIIAFQVTKLALLMIAAGFALSFLAKREPLKHKGRGLMGLGLIFFGMTVMGEALRPLRSHQPFLDWMVRMENPLLGILAGAAFTAVVQSSAATTGVVIVMASRGLVSLQAGIALSFGANIGTCVTALLASIGKPREALRAAVVHVLFNVAGVLVWVGFIGQLARFVTWISPTAEQLTGTAKLAAETPRQIANAHTVFNVANTMIFIWFATLLARFVQWLVPDRPLEEAEAIRAKYLDTELLSTPSLALDRARLELLNMGERVRAMLRAILPALFTGSRESLTDIRTMDDAVDALHGYVVTYLGQISQTRLHEEQTAELLRLLEAANDLENIGDIIETNLVRLGRSRLDGRFTVSPATQQVITEFHEVVSEAVELALVAVSQKNLEAAQRVSQMKAEVNRLADSAALHEAHRLVAEEPNRLPAYTMEMDVLENLKRVYYFAKRMARTTLPEGRLRQVALD